MPNFVIISRSGVLQGRRAKLRAGLKIQGG